MTGFKVLTNLELQHLTVGGGGKQSPGKSKDCVSRAPRRHREPQPGCPNPRDPPEEFGALTGWHHVQTIWLGLDSNLRNP